MKCPNCGGENPDNSKFCQVCGTKIAVPAPEAAADAVNTAAEAVENKVEAAAETVATEVKEAADNAAATAENTVQAASETAEQAAQTVTENVQQAAEQGNTAAQDVQQATWGQAAPAAEQAAEQVNAAAQDVQQAAWGSAPDAAQQSAGEEGEKPKKALNSGLIKIICAVAAVIVVILLLGSLFKGNGGSAASGSVKKYLWYKYDSDSDTTFFFVNDKKTKVTIEGSLYQQAASQGLDVMLAKDKDDTLYYISEKEIKEVATDVKSATMSVNGKYAVYTTKDNNLCLYDISAKKNTVVKEDFKNSAFVVSPGGKSILYSFVNPDKEDAEPYLYLYKGGKETQLAKSLSPLGVSDDGKLMYAYDRNDEGGYRLYKVTTKGDKEKIGNVDSIGDMYFTSDMSQMLYCDGSNIKVSVKGGEPKTVCKGSSLELVTEALVVVAGRIAPVTSFKGQLIQAGSSIYSINSKFEGQQVVSNVVYAQLITKDTLAYAKTNDSKTVAIYKMKAKAGAEQHKLVSNVASMVYFTADGKAMYYIDDEDALRYLKGTGNSKKIMDDVDDLYGVSSKGLAFFTDEDGTLYYTKNGGNKTKVADEVSDCEVTPLFAYYEVKDGKTVTLYLGDGSAKFTKIGTFE